MVREIGADLRPVVTLDTWMEGNWRIWELSESRVSSSAHVIAGRYLGTRSGLTRLMLFEGPVEQGRYIGAWDSRGVGSTLVTV